MLLALKMEKRPQTKGCRWPLEAGKDQETAYTPEPPKLSDGKSVLF